MIAGYPGTPSVHAGDELTLHVSTDQRRFRVRFFRWTGRLEPMERSPWLVGEHALDRSPDQDFAWPAYRFGIPAAWPGGVYLAYLEAQGAPPPAIAMREAAALFVVRAKSAHAILYRLPLCTWHAYNHSGGGCLYDAPPRSTSPPGARVSFRRPGGGIGGPVWGAPDYYDSTSPRNNFAHWDAGFIAWLLREQPGFDVCTDLDIHHEPGIGEQYQLLLSAGHDEYWSEAGRAHVEAFVARGGNVAFFGANTCWWRVHLLDDDNAMVCHQGGPEGALDRWTAGHPAHGEARPEDELTGLSYRHGGGWWDGPRRVIGYRVAQARHWIFDGTGLQDGDVFGATSVPPLVGYECDGAPLARLDPPTLADDAARQGTPDALAILATAQLGDGWQELPGRSIAPAHAPTHAPTHAPIHAATHAPLHTACMSIFSRQGTVFNAGTTDWAQVLANESDARVTGITRNVIRALSRPLHEPVGAALDERAPALAHPFDRPAAHLLQVLQPHRVVVFRALQLGDMLCCVPALRALRSALPHARITLVGLPWAAQFALRYLAYVDDFLAFPGADGFPEQPPAHPAELHAFYATVQARGYDLALQLHGDGSVSNAIVEAFGARRSAGFAPPERTAPPEWSVLPYPNQGRESERLLQLTDHIGAARRGPHLEFPLHSDDWAELRERELDHGLRPGSYACIHAGARTRAKCWPPQRFAQVADHLARIWRLSIVLTGSASEAELAREVKAHMRTPARVAAGPVSIGAMAALMSRARILVCNDTGVSHIAAGLRLPSVVLFSRADITRWSPADQQRHRCVWDPDAMRHTEVLAQVDALMHAVPWAPPQPTAGAPAQRWELFH